jgi:hypothetical protein
MHAEGIQHWIRFACMPSCWVCVFTRSELDLAGLFSLEVPGRA